MVARGICGSAAMWAGMEAGVLLGVEFGRMIIFLNVTAAGVIIGGAIGMMVAGFLVEKIIIERVL